MLVVVVVIIRRRRRGMAVLVHGRRLEVVHLLHVLLNLQVDLLLGLIVMLVHVIVVVLVVHVGLMLMQTMTCMMRLMAAILVR